MADQPRVTIYNDTDSDMPGGALCQWAGGFTTRGGMKVVKPTADDAATLIVNGPFAVGPGEMGYGYLDARGLVAFDPEGDTPQEGDTLGSVSGSWYGAVGGKGFRVLAAAAHWADCIRADIDTVAVEPPTNTNPYKFPGVYLATTAALPSCTYSNGTAGVGATLTGTANGYIGSIDSVSPGTGKDILVKNQSNAAHNGIYTLTFQGDAGAPFVLTRRADADTWDDYGAGVLAVVWYGSINRLRTFKSSSASTIGTSSITWTQYAPGVSVGEFGSGTPNTYGPTETIIVDRDAGLRSYSSGFGAGITQLAASATQNGYVTTGNQTFAGNKSAAASYQWSAGLVGMLNSGYGYQTRFPSGWFGDSPDMTVSDISTFNADGNGAFVLFDGTAGGYGSIFMRRRSDLELYGSSIWIVPNSPVGFSAIGPTYNVYEGSTILVGQIGVWEGDYDTTVTAGTHGVVKFGKTGTVGPSAQFVRGVCVDLGSGSYGTVTSVSGGTSADGVTVSVSTGTTTPVITVTLQDITPDSVTTDTVTTTHNVDSGADVTAVGNFTTSAGDFTTTSGSVSAVDGIFSGNVSGVMDGGTW